MKNTKPQTVTVQELDNDIDILTRLYPSGINKSAIVDYYGINTKQANSVIKNVFRRSDNWESFNDVFLDVKGRETSRHIVFWPKGKERDIFFAQKVSKYKYFLLKLMWENSQESKGIFTESMMENMKCFVDVRYIKDVWGELIKDVEIKSNNKVESWTDIIGAEFKVLRHKSTINADNCFDEEFEEYREVFK